MTSDSVSRKNARYKSTNGIYEKLYVFNNYFGNPRTLLKNVIWRIPSNTSTKKYIFVVGAPRSGTTLLHVVLARHPDLWTMQKESGVFSLQNIFSLNHFALPDDQLMTLRENCADLVEYFDRGVALRSPREIDRTFVEKTPQHVLRIKFILKYFPNSMVVNIIRDGRDCFCSAQTHPNIPQRKSIREFAKYWRKCVARGDAVKSGRMLSIRYEDLTSNPERTLHEVTNHLQIPWCDSLLEYAGVQDRRASRMTFERLKEPIKPSSCGRWRTELSPSENSLFVRIAGNQLKRHGY